MSENGLVLAGEPGDLVRALQQPQSRLFARTAWLVIAPYPGQRLGQDRQPLPAPVARRQRAEALLLPRLDERARNLT